MTAFLHIGHPPYNTVWRPTYTYVIPECLAARRVRESCCYVTTRFRTICRPQDRNDAMKQVNRQT
ncbi:MAG: hypothetical protein ACI351_06205 [Candidatus Avelusimicrobium sp.]|uniref:hypothetical protein n=1 Tax=Candidatus Avelusimicrobium sp. TaxID=3048833 RepID=UPI003EFCDCB6